ncbi:MAG: hypothetical protein H6670_03370 [Anaerolineaceae bacterium]|nr:hypothetical protein [Anaerolineaceae bacterium]
MHLVLNIGVAQTSVIFIVGVIILDGGAVVSTNEGVVGMTVALMAGVKVTNPSSGASGVKTGVESITCVGTDGKI